MLAEDHDISFIQSVTSIVPRHKESIAVLTYPAFDLPWDTHPVPHRNIPDDLDVALTTVRMFCILHFRKLKKPPHTLSCDIFNQIFLLFSSHSRHRYIDPALNSVSQLDTWTFPKTRTQESRIITLILWFLPCTRVLNFSGFPFIPSNLP